MTQRASGGARNAKAKAAIDEDNAKYLNLAKGMVFTRASDEKEASAVDVALAEDEERAGITVDIKRALRALVQKLWFLKGRLQKTLHFKEATYEPNQESARVHEIFVKFVKAEKNHCIGAVKTHAPVLLYIVMLMGTSLRAQRARR